MSSLLDHELFQMTIANIKEESNIPLTLFRPPITGEMHVSPVTNRLTAKILSKPR